jgi:hypothetical protein
MLLTFSHSPPGGADVVLSFNIMSYNDMFSVVHGGRGDVMFVLEHTHKEWIFN